MLYIVPFLISIAVNGVFFVLAVRMKTDVFTDITYSLTFVLVAAFAFAFRSGSVPEQVFALAFVLAWAIRLGSYLFTRIRKTGVDHRFDSMRDNPVSFGSFWALQAVTVWIVMLLYYALMAGGAAAPASPFVARLAFLAGSVIFVAGFLLEAVADRQKSVFKGNPDNAGKFMDRGLWALSRHPNYFGEMLVWWGIALVALPWMRGWSLLTLIGPVFITVLLLFVSGIPLVEKAWKEKWGDDPAFQAYLKKTPLLVPFGRKRA